MKTWWWFCEQSVSPKEAFVLMRVSEHKKWRANAKYSKVRVKYKILICQNLHGLAGMSAETESIGPRMEDPGQRTQGSQQRIQDLDQVPDHGQRTENWRRRTEEQGQSIMDDQEPALTLYSWYMCYFKAISYWSLTNVYHEVKNWIIRHFFISNIQQTYYRLTTKWCCFAPN